MVVTKYFSAEEMDFLAETDVVDVGENRVQALKDKHAYWGDRFRWHMIGPLQTNKVKLVVQICSMIHSVDRLKLAYAIDAEAKKQGARMPSCLQVNVRGEERKQGFRPEELKSVYNELKTCEGLDIQGLMTMAPLVDDLEETRSCFRHLRRLADDLKLKHCSMGMSQDFHVAVEERATIIRLGRVLYKESLG